MTSFWALIPFFEIGLLPSALFYTTFKSSNVSSFVSSGWTENTLDILFLEPSTEEDNVSQTYSPQSSPSSGLIGLDGSAGYRGGILPENSLSSRMMSPVCLRLSTSARFCWVVCFCPSHNVSPVTSNGPQYAVTLSPSSSLGYVFVSIATDESFVFTPPLFAVVWK